MNKQNQNGSLHLVVLIVVVLVITGALGFLFWKNFINKSHVAKNENTNTNQLIDATPKEKMKVGQIDSLFPASLSWKYPESWSLQSEGGGPHSESETSIQTITLTSPSKKYQVVYKVAANAGFGGTCDRNSPYTGKLQYINRKSTLNYPGTLFIEYIHNTHSGGNGQVNFDGYTYVSAIYSDEARIQNAKVGSSLCDVIYGGILQLADKSDTRLLAAEIKLKNIDPKQSSDTLVKEIDLIKKEYTTPEYLQAVNILLSTQKK